MGNVISKEKEKSNVEIEWESSDEEEPLEDEDTFEFSQLPSELQYYIVEKLTYKEFSALDGTSRLGNAICRAKKYTPEFRVYYISVYKKTVKLVRYHWRWKRLIRWHLAMRQPARIEACGVAIQSKVSSGRIQAIAKLFEKNRTRAIYLRILNPEPIEFKPADLDRLIKALSVTFIYCRQFVPREFFQLEGMKNMGYISLKTGSDFTDDDLLALKCEELVVNNDFITSKGLNRFLMQWKEKKREIEDISIDFDASIGTRDIDDILAGLDANVIWTPDFHKHSLVAKIKVEEFELMNDGNPKHVYSIWRADEIEYTIFIIITADGFHTFANEKNETVFLLDQLRFDQCHIVLGRCPTCARKFCKHRRRFLTAGFKENYPRLYNFLDKFHKAFIILSKVDAFIILHALFAFILFVVVFSIFLHF